MTKSRTIREYLQSIPPENTATRVSFFLAGFMMAIWAAMVPFVKARLSLDEAHLGTLLLCVGLGALFVMPFCGGIIARRGVGFLLKKAYFFAALLLCVVYFSENLFLTAAILFLFGMIFGSIDVSMNVHAVEVDQRSPKRLIAGFHALYSFGNVAGALGMAALLNVDISVWMAVAALLALGLLLWLLVSRHLLSDAGCSTEKTPAFAVPKGFVLLLGLICFVLFMVEGAVLDWGGVFLIQEKSVAIENAGLAFASFATAMTVMRLFGDRLITLAGPRYFDGQSDSDAHEYGIGCRHDLGLRWTTFGAGFHWLCGKSHGFDGRFCVTGRFNGDCRSELCHFPPKVVSQNKAAWVGDPSRLTSVKRVNDFAHRSKGSRWHPDNGL